MTKLPPVFLAIVSLGHFNTPIIVCLILKLSLASLLFFNDIVKIQIIPYPCDRIIGEHHFFHLMPE